MGLATLVYKPGRILPDPAKMKRLLFMAMNKKVCWFRAIDLVKTIRSLIYRKVYNLNDEGAERRYMRLITQLACALHAVCEKEPKASMENGGMSAVMEIASVISKWKNEERFEWMDCSILGRCILL